MTWVKIDDNAPHHRKLRAAGPEAAWLWVAGLAHCNRFATDGRIEALDLDVLYPFPGWNASRLRALAADLVRVGLWEVAEGGWKVHHYEDFQGEAMRSARDERREWERQRKANQRAAAKSKRVESAPSETMSHRDRGGTGVGHVPSVVPPAVPPLSLGCPSPPTRPDPTREEEIRGRETLRAPDPEPPALELTANEPPAPKAPRKPRKAPNADPPPFSHLDALAALAGASGGRVAHVEPRDLDGGTTIALRKMVRSYPSLEEWRVCGEWIAAGGERTRQKFGASWAASAGLRDAMAASRAWADGGRPTLLDAKGFPVVAAAEPAAPDQWAEARRKWEQAHGGAA